MTFTTASRMACLAFMANALAATATASDKHNFIVLMPEAMSPGSVNELQTPALARLRDEGVSYSRTFSGFPQIRASSHLKSTVDRAEQLVGLRRGGYAAMMFHERAAPSDASIDAALARLQGEGRPFMLVYRLRGIDALSDTDSLLAAVENKLKEQDLFDRTNIVVVAEHGRSTVWKQSKTSYTRDMSFSGVPTGKLPPGFLAIDLIKAMLREDSDLNLYDPDQDGERVSWRDGNYPRAGNAVIAANWEKPHVKIQSHGGYDFIYMPVEMDPAEVARRGRYLIENLFQQDYVSGVFVNEKRIGQVGGALSLEYLRVNTDYDDGDQLPDIVVNFTSTVMSCDHYSVCAMAISDTPAEEGQDMALGFSRAETKSFMAARGPDFRKAFSSKTPASPADMMRTIELLTARRTGADLKGKDARVLTESLRGLERRRAPRVREWVAESKASRAGEHTVARTVTVNGVRYFIAAGAPGRSVGLPVGDEPYYWHWESPWKLVRISIKP